MCVCVCVCVCARARVCELFFAFLLLFFVVVFVCLLLLLGYADLEIKADVAWMLGVRRTPRATVRLAVSLTDMCRCEPSRAKHPEGGLHNRWVKRSITSGDNPVI